ncbi:MAG: S9 family peptidase [Bacteroidales bacterium]
MKSLSRLFVLTFGILVFMVFGSCSDQNSGSNKAPVAKKIQKELTIHGDTRIDEYFWLNERENPEVIAYLTAENEYTEAQMKDTKELQEELFDEMVGRIKQDDETVPYKYNGYYYYTRYEEGKEYPLYCRKKDNLESSEEVLLNVNEMAAGYAYYQVGDWSVSTDNNLLAYSVDTVSRRKYSLFVKNLETGEFFEDKVDNTSGSVTWANDNQTLFYVVKDETLRPCKIYRHKLGQKGEDALIFHEKDATYTADISKSKSRKFLFVQSYSTLSSEYQILDANNPDGAFKVFYPREDDLLYSVQHYKDKFYVLTNSEAQNFRLMETPVNRTNKEFWKEVIPHRVNVLIEDFEIFENFLAIKEKADGLDKIRIYNLKTNKDYYIEFDEETYVNFLSVNPEFDTEILRFMYSSLTTPSSVYDFNMTSRDRILLKRDEIIGDFDPQNYQSKRLFATATDGVKVPISIVYRKGLDKNGTNPLWISGYGAYGYSSMPYFSSVRLSLLDRGFVVAIAHVRGGQEMGRQWYEDGKLLNKKNTFTDFIACTQQLINEGYTSPDRCFAWGGSAGGLLMGAIVNMRPDLYKGVIAAVPFVDVITTMLDESIPLTTGEYDEWGNPNDKTYYDYILSYSPYDQVEAKDYPAMLVTTGLHDSQVQYWEPAKWVAKLRDMKTDNNLLLLSTQMDFGHGGASGRFERYRENALEYAFALKLLGDKK